MSHRDIDEQPDVLRASASHPGPDAVTLAGLAADYGVNEDGIEDQAVADDERAGRAERSA